MSDWSEREEWVVTGQGWARRSRGAPLRLTGPGEVLRGVPCGESGPYLLCLQSEVLPGNFLVAREEGRMVWDSPESLSQCAYVRRLTVRRTLIIEIFPVLRVLHWRPQSGKLLQVPDNAGTLVRSWSGSQPPHSLRSVPGLVLD